MKVDQSKVPFKQAYPFFYLSKFFFLNHFKTIFYDAIPPFY